MIDGRSIRRAVLAWMVVSILGLGGLALAGGRDERSTAFSLQVPSSMPVTVVRRDEPVCQRTLVAGTAFRGVQLWVGAVPSPGATLEVRAQATGGGSLGSGTVLVSAAQSSSPRVWFGHVISGGARLSICFEDLSEQPVPLLGAAAGPSSGALVRGGRGLGTAASMVMLSPHPRSMLNLLPTIFHRAALFRPSWMGDWTYWTLLAAVLAAFPLAAASVVLAARRDASA